MDICWLALACCCLFPADSGGQQESGAIVIGAARPDEDGFLVHAVTSPFQAGTTQIRVLLPERRDPGKKYRVVYVLPVEAGNESRFGNGLREIKQLDLANKRDIVFVAPTFSQLPWYADHPTKPEVRQESYLLKVVVPWIDKTYPVQAQASGRLLLGFSKSGWGAYSLLLRNPETFGKAAAWDAPLMLDRPGAYGSGPIFGTPDNFENYHITKLLEDRADMLRRQKRLVLLGYKGFREHHLQIHALLERLGIPHDNRDGPVRKHDWHSGWVSEAVELLVQDDTRN